MTDPSLLVRFTEQDAAHQLRADVRAGLTSDPKWLSPKWFYDATGSELFERITRLPEYYQTRAEQQILQQHAMDIAELTKAAALCELGAGSAEKTRLLLNALTGAGTLRQYTPLDVSREALQNTVAAIAADYPEVEVTGIVDDFTRGLAELRIASPGVLTFLGGTIGNLLPAERAAFFAAAHAALAAGEWLLLGADLVKATDRLVSAYDDARGVTAEFNRNVLHVLNRELAADFAPEDFAHVAVWNTEQQWMEMRLRALRPMRVRLSALDMTVDFAEGEELRTEVSAKFTQQQVHEELTAAGFSLQCWWTDEAGDFALALATA
ncbi:L-histidine N(alpha)-methyltransferase [Saccharopolyspora rectivirgula]|jgi:L-histidine N-alpha-methyltransferase|uniref:Histidyl-tRNA synthetase n=1 Tax=Saccharopolyspora rectivirgula TaxID=28042 RepID=A0A073AX60_9PSEU|nr:L-histidine N(alpha)-methyltransferase [Saccharopolyspora rectivirgula]KEI43990.1 histidyl-tRNA synthetase [Saccharopolyspora rectivirgula]